MGCDIHTRIEYRRDEKEGWLNGDFYRYDPNYRGNDPYATDPMMLIEVCDERDYELFAVLADVRNYNNVECIDEPRGMPDDVSFRVERDHDDWGADAHSASWFTLKELIDWNEKHTGRTKRSGYMPKALAERLDKDGTEPTFWCGRTSDESWEYREWEVDYHPLGRLIDELKRRGRELWLWFSDEQAYANADKIRFVFWFDN